MAQTPDNESKRVRWTDEMLDKLASDVWELKETVSELKEGVSELKETVSQVRDSVDGVRVTAQALLQLAAQQQQENQARKAEIAEIAESNRKYEEWRQESDRRFYTLLDEVRYLNRRVTRIEGEDGG